MRTQNRVDLTLNQLRYRSLALAAAIGLGAGGVHANPITWNLLGGGGWDTGTPNWTADAGATSTTFTDDGTVAVIFNNAAGGTITIDADMSPLSTTVSAGSYTFNGAPVASGSLTKSGGGTLTLMATPANFSSIAVQGGTLYLRADQFAPNGASFNMTNVTIESGAFIQGERANIAGNLTMNGGTWWDNNGFGGGWTGPVTLAADSFFGRNGGGYDLTINGTVSGTGGFTKLGGSTLTLTGASSSLSEYTGKTIVQGGTLLTSGAAYLSNTGLPGVFGAPTGANATIDLHNGVTLRNNGSNPRVNQSTDRSLNLAGDGAGTVSIRYNDNDASLTFGGVTATGTGPKLLKIDTGINGSGDREAIIFTGGISDSADNTSATSVAVTFNTQGSPNWVSLSGVNTFTGPITLAQINGTANGVLVIGGVRVAGSGANTVGTGSLGSGNYPGDITLGARTVLEYDSTAAQTLAGAISGPGAVQVTGSGTVTLTGPNTYSGNTSINSGGTLVLSNDGVTSFGALNFVLTNTSSNKISGAGSATLDGIFTIDTSAVTTPIASWTLVDVTTKSFGSTFSMAGFDDNDADDIWTKTDGFATWTFTEASGVLSVNTLATMTSFGIPGFAGVIDNSASTISLSVPYGTVMTTLAPDFTVTSGIVTANGNAVSSGSPPSPTFSDTNPSTATYTVTDGLAVSNYTVTVTVAPAPPGGLGVGAGLVAWFDASQLTGLSNGNSVETWSDLSGYGHNASRSAGTMTYATSQVNALPTVQFRNAGYANITGTLFAKEQYIVFKSPSGNSYNGDWGAVMGNVTDQSGYMMGNGTNFWGGNYPAAVSQNGNVLVNPWNITNMSNFLILKIVGAYPNTNPRSYSLGNTYGNGSPQYHNLNLDVAEIIAYDHPLTEAEEAAVGGYLKSKYNIVDATYPTGPQANITSFTFPTYGDATIAGTTITRYVPNGTVITALAPTFTLSADATCDPVSGSTQDFSGGAVNYLVTASDNTTKNYTVTVIVLPPGPPVAGYTRWFDASTLGLADAAPVTQWDDGSGNGANATVPSGNATPVYVANAGMESGLGAIYFAKNSGAGNSGALRFTRDSGIRTVFSVFKGNSFLLTDADAYHFHRNTDDSPTDPLWVGYTSDYIKGGSTYVNGVLVNGTSYNMPTNLHNGFNLVEVITTGNVQADSFNKDRTSHAGNQYQAEVILYDRVLTETERLQVEAYLTNKWFTAASGPTFVSWAAAQDPEVTGGVNGDSNNDGVQNGIAYFMNDAGRLTNPGPDGTNTVTWTNGGNIPATEYGSQFVVQTSPDLVEWTPVPNDGSDTNLSNTEGSVSYTLPPDAAGGKLFVRLVVMPD